MGARLGGRLAFPSDHHWGHAAARSLYRRPFTSVAEMDQVMIDRWNAVVEPDDEVWHLGDFAVRQPAERVACLLMGSPALSATTMISLSQTVVARRASSGMPNWRSMAPCSCCVTTFS